MTDLRRIIFAGTALLGLLCAAMPARAAEEKGFDAPEGLTLQARSAGRYLLLWEPLSADSLMGYSVWLRRQGEKEFVRLSVPVKVGKEVQKQPMISDSKLELKLGDGRKDLEFAVVAEYEDGPSARSASVFSTRAALAPLVGKSVEAPVVAMADAVSATTGAAAPRKADPYADDDKQPQPEGPSPWDNRSVRLKRALLTPAGKWRTSFGASFEILRSVYSGRDPMRDLRLQGTNIPASKVVEWRRVDTRTRFRAYLHAEYGLLPNMELWAEGAYHAEDVSINVYDIDGQNFNYIRYGYYLPDGSIFYFPDPSSTGFGDTQIGARLSPWPQQPLLLQAQATLPTGKSRMASDLDWERGKAFGAGTGEGITRFWAKADWGWRGLRPGPSLHAAFSPGSAERITNGTGSNKTEDVITHGDIGEAGVDYTLPWTVLSRDGAIVPFATVRSISASRWTENGTDVSPYLNKIERSRLAAHGGIKFNAENQLELGVEAMQDLPGGFETGGRLAYTSGLFGDQVLISGRLVY